MKTALLSVSDKTNLVDFAKALLEADYQIISTGGTFKVLQEHGLPCRSVESVTQFPEMMDGRVKTLHPNIHGGLLARRDNEEHLLQAKQQGITLIDLVCVNLYPFKKTVESPYASHEIVIENIDIGGPSMLRSAAKNYESVYVVCDPQDYDQVIAQINQESNESKAFLQYLAGKVYAHTAAYDATIAHYFNKINDIAHPQTLTLSYELKQALRYGENPHQSAAFYTPGQKTCSLDQAHVLHGKALSYNNIQDAYAAVALVKEFDQPVYVALKHTNPCGIGWDENPTIAWEKAYDADPISIFGGIVATNQVVDEKVASQMSQIFLEVVIAQGFSEEALAILTRKANIRLLTLDFHLPLHEGYEVKSVGSDLLVQQGDAQQAQRSQLRCVSETQAEEADLRELIVAQRIVKHVKSNAIVLVKDGQSVGIGAGQMNRVGALALALKQAGAKAHGALLGSDAFFPMNDSVLLAAEHGIKAIVQPGGSIKDQESIDACNQHGIAMYFSGVRHFKH
ncbi:MAG: bifunctional phosphoribosylaminoimidazolecarboxamide formyltransferase/IMP cyclohydrolase [Erysipelotrichaceae bacterium]